jgi:hypothetical protein
MATHAARFITVFVLLVALTVDALNVTWQDVAVIRARYPAAKSGLLDAMTLTRSLASAAVPAVEAHMAVVVDLLGRNTILHADPSHLFGPRSLSGTITLQMERPFLTSTNETLTELASRVYNGTVVNAGPLAVPGLDQVLVLVDGVPCGRSTIRELASWLVDCEGVPDLVGYADAYNVTVMWSARVTSSELALRWTTTSIAAKLTAATVAGWSSVVTPSAPPTVLVTGAWLGTERYASDVSIAHVQSAEGLLATAVATASVEPLDSATLLRATSPPNLDATVGTYADYSVFDTTTRQMPGLPQRVDHWSVAEQRWYTAVVAPVVSSWFPTNVIADRAARITVIGTGFSTLGARVAMSFGGLPCSATDVVSDSVVECTTTPINTTAAFSSSCGLGVALDGFHVTAPLLQSFAVSSVGVFVPDVPSNSNIAALQLLHTTQYVRPAGSSTRSLLLRFDFIAPATGDYVFHCLSVDAVVDLQMTTHRTTNAADLRHHVSRARGALCYHEAGDTVAAFGGPSPTILLSRDRTAPVSPTVLRLRRGQRLPLLAAALLDPASEKQPSVRICAAFFSNASTDSKAPSRPFMVRVDRSSDFSTIEFGAQSVSSAEANVSGRGQWAKAVSATRAVDGDALAAALQQLLRSVANPGAVVTDESHIGGLIDRNTAAGTSWLLAVRLQNETASLPPLRANGGNVTVLWAQATDAVWLDPLPPDVLRVPAELWGDASDDTEPTSIAACPEIELSAPSLAAVLNNSTLLKNATLRIRPNTTVELPVVSSVRPTTWTAALRLQINLRGSNFDAHAPPSVWLAAAGRPGIFRCDFEVTCDETLCSCWVTASAPAAVYTVYAVFPTRGAASAVNQTRTAAVGTIARLPTIVSYRVGSDIGTTSILAAAAGGTNLTLVTRQLESWTLVPPIQVYVGNATCALQSLSRLGVLRCVLPSCGTACNAVNATQLPLTIAMTLMPTATLAVGIVTYGPANAVIAKEASVTLSLYGDGFARPLTVAAAGANLTGSRVTVCPAADGAAVRVVHRPCFLCIPTVDRPSSHTCLVAQGTLVPGSYVVAIMRQSATAVVASRQHVVALRVTGMEPANVSLGGFTRVTIFGSGLRAETEVLVGPTACLPSTVAIAYPRDDAADGQLSCVLAPNPDAATRLFADMVKDAHMAQVRTRPMPLAVRDIILGNASPFEIAVDDPVGTTYGFPRVRKVSPRAVTAGTLVRVDGFGFEADMTVMLGDVRCVPTVVYAVQLECRMAAEGSGGPTEIRVLTADGAGASVSVVAHAPFVEVQWAVKRVSPSAGSIAGGQSITIFGYGMPTDARIDLGGVGCVIANRSSSAVVCITRARSTLSAWSGPITVTSATANASRTCCTYSYALELTAVVTDVSPTAGQPGTRLTISGSRFISAGSDYTVSFAGNLATGLAALSDERVNAIVPRTAAFVALPVVVYPGVGVAWLDAAVSPFTLSAVASRLRPTESVVGGGQIITIFGDAFIASANEGNVSVEVCGRPCAVVSFDRGSLACRTPPVIRPAFMTRWPTIVPVPRVLTEATVTTGATAELAPELVDGDFTSFLLFENTTAVVLVDAPLQNTILLQRMDLYVASASGAAGSWAVTLEHSTNGGASFATSTAIVHTIMTNSTWISLRPTVPLSDLYTHVRAVFKSSAGSLQAHNLLRLSEVRVVGAFAGRGDPSTSVVCPINIRITHVNSSQSVPTCAQDLGDGCLSVTYLPLTTPTITAVTGFPTARYGSNADGSFTAAESAAIDATVVTFEGSGFGLDPTALEVGLPNSRLCVNGHPINTIHTCTPSGLRNATTAHPAPSTYLVRSGVGEALDLLNRLERPTAYYPFSALTTWMLASSSQGARQRGTFPDAGAVVVVPRDMTVVITESTPVLSAIVVEGTLRITTPTRRNLGTTAEPLVVTAAAIIVKPGGRLQVGTQNVPIAFNVEFRLICDLTTTTEAVRAAIADPDSAWAEEVAPILRAIEQPIGVIAVVGGEIRLFAAAARASSYELAVPAEAGSFSIVLSSVAGLEIGDEVTLADGHRTEAVVITSLVASTGTISIQTPLQFTHAAERYRTIDGTTKYIGTARAIATQRLITIVSNDIATTKKTHRGPAIIVRPAIVPDATFTDVPAFALSGVVLRDCGWQDSACIDVRSARNCGDCLVDLSAVQRAYGPGAISLFATDGVDISRTVVIDTAGHGVALTGASVDAVLTSNVVVNAGRLAGLRSDRAPAYLFSAPAVTVRSCVAAHATGAGFDFTATADRTTSRCSAAMPLTEFTANVAVGCVLGLHVSGHRPIVSSLPATSAVLCSDPLAQPAIATFTTTFVAACYVAVMMEDSSGATMTSMTHVDCTYGVVAAETQRLVLRDWVFVNVALARLNRSIAETSDQSRSMVFGPTEAVDLLVRRLALGDALSAGRSMAALTALPGSDVSLVGTWRVNIPAGAVLAADASTIDPSPWPGSLLVLDRTRPEISAVRVRPPVVRVAATFTLQSAAAPFASSGAPLILLTIPAVLRTLALGTTTSSVVMFVGLHAEQLTPLNNTRCTSADARTAFVLSDSATQPRLVTCAALTTNPFDNLPSSYEWIGVQCGVTGPADGAMTALVEQCLGSTRGPAYAISRSSQVTAQLIVDSDTGLAPSIRFVTSSGTSWRRCRVYQYSLSGSSPLPSVVAGFGAANTVILEASASTVDMTAVHAQESAPTYAPVVRILPNAVLAASVQRDKAALKWSSLATLEDRELALLATTLCSEDATAVPCRPQTAPALGAATSAVAERRWSQAAGWPNGTLPGDGALVVIAVGETVAFDVDDTPALLSIFIAGTLRLGGRTTRGRACTQTITATAIVVATGGTLVLDTTNTTACENLSIRLGGPLTRRYVLDLGRPELSVREGGLFAEAGSRVVLRGSPVGAPTWAPLRVVEGVTTAVPVTAVMPDRADGAVAFEGVAYPLRAKVELNTPWTASQLIVHADVESLGRDLASFPSALYSDAVGVDAQPSSFQYAAFWNRTLRVEAAAQGSCGIHAEGAAEVTIADVLLDGCSGAGSPSADDETAAAILLSSVLSVSLDGVLLRNTDTRGVILRDSFYAQVRGCVIEGRLEAGAVSARNASFLNLSATLIAGYTSLPNATSAANGACAVQSDERSLGVTVSQTVVAGYHSRAYCFPAAIAADDATVTDTLCPQLIDGGVSHGTSQLVVATGAAFGLELQPVRIAARSTIPCRDWSNLVVTRSRTVGIAAASGAELPVLGLSRVMLHDNFLGFVVPQATAVSLFAVVVGGMTSAASCAAVPLAQRVPSVGIAVPFLPFTAFSGGAAGSLTMSFVALTRFGANTAGCFRSYALWYGSSEALPPLRVELAGNVTVTVEADALMPAATAAPRCVGATSDASAALCSSFHQVRIRDASTLGTAFGASRTIASTQAVRYMPNLATGAVVTCVSGVTPSRVAATLQECPSQSWAVLAVEAFARSRDLVPVGLWLRTSDGTEHPFAHHWITDDREAAPPVPFGSSSRATLLATVIVPALTEAIALTATGLDDTMRLRVQLVDCDVGVRAALIVPLRADLAASAWNGTTRRRMVAVDREITLTDELGEYTHVKSHVTVLIACGDGAVDVHLLPASVIYARLYLVPDFSRPYDFLQQSFATALGVLPARVELFESHPDPESSTPVSLITFKLRVSDGFDYDPVAAVAADVSGVLAWLVTPDAAAHITAVMGMQVDILSVIAPTLALPPPPPPETPFTIPIGDFAAAFAVAPILVFGVLFAIAVRIYTWRRRPKSLDDDGIGKMALPNAKPHTIRQTNAFTAGPIRDQALYDRLCLGSKSGQSFAPAADDSHSLAMSTQPLFVALHEALLNTSAMFSGSNVRSAIDGANWAQGSSNSGGPSSVRGAARTAGDSGAGRDAAEWGASILDAAVAAQQQAERRTYGFYRTKEPFVRKRKPI